MREEMPSTPQPLLPAGEGGVGLRPIRIKLSRSLSGSHRKQFKGSRSETFISATSFGLNHFYVLQYQFQFVQLIQGNCYSSDEFPDRLAHLT